MKRRIAIYGILILLTALSIVGLVFSYQPSVDSRYRGWWTYLTIARNHNLGFRLVDGDLLAWYICDKPNQVWPARTFKRFGPFQISSASGGCSLEGEMGIPWDVVNAMNVSTVSARTIRSSIRPVPILLALSGLFFGIAHYRQNRKRKDRCVRCGYSLQGLTERRCPECGTGF